MVYEIVVLTLLLPACLSAAAVFFELLASGLRPGDERVDRAAWLAGGVAGAGSFLLAYCQFSWTEIFPSDYWHWLPQAVVVITITALLAAMAQRVWACVIVLPAIFIFAWLMTPAWDEVARIRPWGAFALGAAMLLYLLLALPLQCPRRAKQQWVIGLVLTVHLMAATVVVFSTHWAKLAQLAALPLVVFSVLTVLSWLYWRRQFLVGAVPIFAVVFPATLLLAWYWNYGPISPWAFVLPAMGPLVLLVVLAVTRKASRLTQNLAMLSVLIFPLAGVVIAIVTTL